MLLLRRQEGHPACKKHMGGWWKKGRKMVVMGGD